MKPRELRVHLLPSLVEPADLPGRTVVVIDVLRATTTVCHALQSGAAAVVPCLEIDEARAQANAIGSAAVLGGERGGLRIEGFDLGNSPTEYVPRTVADRTVVFTTTNGTRALHRSTTAAEILLGAFVNLSAVVGVVQERERVDLVCAGTNGVITAEDALFAGAVVDRLLSAGSGEWGMANDSALLACDAWRRTVAAGRPLAEVLRACQGGRNLIAEGFDADIDTAARIDSVPVLPRFTATTGRITR